MDNGPAPNHSFTRSPDHGASLRIIPLGGVGTFGMNCTAFEFDGRILVVDAGVKIPQGNYPGVDLIIPDFSYLFSNAARVCGVVLTHGHDDHVGALPFLLRELSAPVYGTAFTLALARERMDNYGQPGTPEADLRQMMYGEPVQVGPFRVEPVRVCHSVPDSAALIIRAGGMTVVHSGDFRLGPDSPGGCTTDLDRLAEIKKEGVDALLCDSTNADRPGVTPPESEVAQALEGILRDAPGRVFIATFASHIQRVGMVLEAVRRTGRRVQLEGRRMQRNAALARDLGFLAIPPGVMADGDESADPRAVFIITGSQGEPTSALARVARGEHAAVRVHAGDTVVFSSRIIPGNELAVGQIIDSLCRLGAVVHYQAPPRIHVSGHGGGDEIKTLISAVRPRVFIPIHGDYRQLSAAAGLARETGVPNEGVFILDPGQVISIRPDRAGPDGDVPSGRMLVDGEMVGDHAHPALRDRRRLAREGVVVVVASLPQQGEAPAVPPAVHSAGVGIEGSTAEFDLRASGAAAQVIDEFRRHGGSLDELREELRTVVRAVYRKEFDKRPLVVPVVIEE